LSEAIRLSFDQLDVAARVHAFELLVGRVTRSKRFPQNTQLGERRSDGYDPLRTLRVRDAAEMFAVERVGYELQPECFAAG
jgi:hypothetical protein